VIPFTAGRRPDGRPDLGTVDLENLYLCADLDVCGVCGKPLDDRRELLADNLFIETTEPPMHARCAQLALRSCPHLRKRGGSYWLARSSRPHDVQDWPDGMPHWLFDPDLQVVTNARTGDRFPSDWRASEAVMAAAADADWLREQQFGFLL